MQLAAIAAQQRLVVNLGTLAGAGLCLGHGISPS
jgi:hypothetical protein